MLGCYDVGDMREKEGTVFESLIRWEVDIAVGDLLELVARKALRLTSGTAEPFYHFDSRGAELEGVVRCGSGRRVVDFRVIPDLCCARHHRCLCSVSAGMSWPASMSHDRGAASVYFHGGAHNP